MSSKSIFLKISIITVVRNDASGLLKTIQSVQEQSYSHFEHVIIDGASTDETPVVLRRYADENANCIVISEPDTGIYNAMNKGIKVVTGTYVLFLNAGDILASNTILADIFKYIRTTSLLPKIIYGGANVYTDDGVRITSLSPLYLTHWNLNMFATRVVCHQSIFVRTDCVVPYNELYTLKAELDWYYSLVKTTKKEERLYLLDYISNYHLGGASSKQWKINFREMIAVTRAHNSLFSFIVTCPFFVIPLIFRIKQHLYDLPQNKRDT